MNNKKPIHPYPKPLVSGYGLLGTRVKTPDIFDKLVNNALDHAYAGRGERELYWSENYFFMGMLVFCVLALLTLFLGRFDPSFLVVAFIFVLISWVCLYFNEIYAEAQRRFKRVEMMKNLEMRW